MSKKSTGNRHNYPKMPECQVVKPPEPPTCKKTTPPKCPRVGDKNV